MVSGREIWDFHSLGRLFGSRLWQRVVSAPYVSAGTAEFQHHVATFGPHARFGYKDFVPLFKGEHFDPAHGRRCSGKRAHAMSFPWQNIMTASRCTTEFFPMERGQHGTAAGHYGRTRRRGAPGGPGLWVSTHRAEHWWFFNGGRQFDSDVRDPAIRISMARRCPAPTIYATAIRNRHRRREFLEDWYARTPKSWTNISRN